MQSFFALINTAGCCSVCNPDVPVAKVLRWQVTGENKGFATKHICMACLEKALLSVTEKPDPGA